MSRPVRRIVKIALAAALAWSGGQPAVATGVCTENVIVGKLCVLDEPGRPVTCEQTGVLATCDLLEDPCGSLSLCYVCPTGDPCPPPTRLP